MRRLQLFASLLLVVGCEPTVSCGAGTRLEGSMCVSDPGTDGGTLDGARVDGGAPDDARTDAAAGHDGGVPGTDAASGDLVDGDPCPTDGMGHNMLSPSCVGNDLRSCSGSFVRITDCTELGDRCVPGASPSDLPRCDGGVYVACSVSTSAHSCADSGHALLCSGGYPNAPGFTYTIPCTSFGAGYTCLMNTTEGGCYPPGTVSCDPTSSSSGCSADGSAIQRCSDGLQYTLPCEDQVAGTVCDLDGNGEPVCVPRGAARCDGATYHGSCISDSVIQECDFLTSHVGVYSCPGATRCQVSASGFAACVAPGTPSCDRATYVSRCLDHDHLGQCGRGGFESGIDCVGAGAGHRCIPDTTARCGVATDCVAATYVANCDGNNAWNCRSGGWLEEQVCPSFSPCHVASGTAVCGL